jgi:hypothetical protein
MKQTKLFIGSTILVSLLYFSCKGNNSNATTAKDSASSNTATATASTSGDASFSCKIDGKDFSGNGSDNYANAAFKTNPGIISFTLVKMDKTQRGIPEQFSFTVADHGITTMHNSNSTDNGNFSAKYSPRDYNDAFGFREVTVTITSSDASGIKGTFSGTLINPQGDKEIPVTDGKFDLPWSSYSKK